MLQQKNLNYIAKRETTFWFTFQKLSFLAFQGASTEAIGAALGDQLSTPLRDGRKGWIAQFGGKHDLTSSPGELFGGKMEQSFGLSLQN
jgi:hypothetical protein